MSTKLQLINIIIIIIIIINFHYNNCRLPLARAVQCSVCGNVAEQPAAFVLRLPELLTAAT